MAKSASRPVFVVIVLILLVALMVLRRSPSPGNKSNGEVNRKGGIAFNRNTALLVYSKHARCRMGCRLIDSSEVQEILQQGIINYRKSDTLGPRDPKFALEGRTHDNQRVRIIFAAAPTKTVVVTVIDLDQDIQCECP